MLKNKFLLNSVTLIKLGIKKSNLNRVQIIVNNIKLLQENLGKLKEITDDSSKIQEFFEIYNKSVYIIELLKSNKTELKILAYSYFYYRHIEEDYALYFKKITNKLYGELIQFSIDQLYKSVTFLDVRNNSELNFDNEIIIYVISCVIQTERKI